MSPAHSRCKSQQHSHRLSRHSGGSCDAHSMWYRYQSELLSMLFPLYVHGFLDLIRAVQQTSAACRSSHTFVAHLVLLVLPFPPYQGFVAESHKFLAQYAVDFRARHGDDIQELRTIMNADALNKNHSSANEVCHVNPTPARPPLWRRVHSTHWVWLVLCVVHSMPVAC